jgi:hypothetical protein
MISIEINHDELRYLISCGPALLQNIPEKSLSTYCHFTKDQIIELMIRFREIADNNGVDI